VAEDRFNPLFWGQCLHLLERAMSGAQNLSFQSPLLGAVPSPNLSIALERVAEMFQSPLLGAVPSPKKMKLEWGGGMFQSPLLGAVPSPT